MRMKCVFGKSGGKRVNNFEVYIEQNCVEIGKLN